MYIDFILLAIFSLIWFIPAVIYLIVDWYKLPEITEEAKLTHIEKIRELLTAANQKLPEDNKITSFSVQFPNEKEPRKIEFKEQ